MIGFEMPNEMYFQIAIEYEARCLGIEASSPLSLESASSHSMHTCYSSELSLTLAKAINGGKRSSIGGVEDIWSNFRVSCSTAFIWVSKFAHHSPSELLSSSTRFRLSTRTWPLDEVCISFFLKT